MSNMSNRAKIFISVLIAYAVIGILAVLIGLSSRADDGLIFTFKGENGTARTVSHWRWPYFDSASIQSDGDVVNGDSIELRLTGIVWRGSSGQTTWRIEHTGNSIIKIDGQVVPLNLTDRFTTQEITVNWTKPWVELEVVATLSTKQYLTTGGRFEFGIYEQTAWNTWSLIPAYRLYTAPPLPNTVTHQEQRDHLIRAAFYGLLAGLILLGGAHVWRLRLWKYRAVWILLGITLLALIVRLELLHNRTASDPFFYYSDGNDNYVLRARQTLSNQSALVGSFFMPGNTLWLAFLTFVLGPRLWPLYVANMVTGSLSVSAIAGASWLLYGRRAGIISGIAAALFPPLIFYHGTMQTASPVAAFIPVVILLGILAIKRPSWVTWSGFGFALGFTTLIRLTVGVIGVAYVIALISKLGRAAWRDALRSVIIPVSAVAACSILILLPIVVTNRVKGNGVLISSDGPYTLYWANNRDGDGGVRQGQAHFVARARGDDYVAATQKDIRNNPTRAVEVVLHKLGLLYSNHLPFQIVGYRRQGIAISFLLRTLSLGRLWGMTSLAFLALTGLGARLLDRPYRDEGTLFLASALGLMTLIIIVFTVYERIQAQLWPLLCIALGALVSYGLARRGTRYLLVSSCAVALLLGTLWGFERYLPRKQYIQPDDMPADTISYIHDFGDEVQLLGYAPPEVKRVPGGYLYLTLYWKALAAKKSGYGVFIQLVTPDDHAVINYGAYPLGHITYPEKDPYEWPKGSVLEESYLIQIPPEVPDIVGVEMGLMGFEGVTLFHLGFESPNPPDSGVDLRDVSYRLGDQLWITGMNVPDHLAAGQPLAISIRWEVTQTLYEDYTVFYHLLDQDNNLITQIDSALLTGNWTTSALVPNQPVTSLQTLTLPDNLRPGTYILEIGAYRLPSVQRVPVRDQAMNVLADDVIRLSVTVGP
jgi:4-amino-4-deoxy-L-arabinose transferase-like glycosyltransferase